MKSKTIIVAGCLLILVMGCEQKKSFLSEQMFQLGREKSKLERQVEQLEDENQTLRGQVKELSALGPEIRLEALSQVSKIKLGDRTGLYDRDKDGINEKLIVYVRPFDETSDAIKAVGKVDVELWDLNTKTENALIRQWQVTPEEMRDSWAGTLLTNYYRLIFEVGDLSIDDERELTIKVSFTDYITGKTFRQQRVIEAR